MLKEKRSAHYKRIDYRECIGVKIYINDIPDCRLIAEDKDSGFL